MAKLRLSTGREVDTERVKAINWRGGYAEVQFKTGDPDKTDDINVSVEDAEKIEKAREGGGE